MASTDRYRPPRESYQPPIPTRQPSRSPARRRDVPPPAPSPPTHSSRTSPPRAHSPRPEVVPSPIGSAPQTPGSSLGNQWLFTADEVRSTPSIIDGLSPAEERLRRAKGVNFIYQAGVLLDLPQITLWVAGVFFHRFYMRKSMVEEKNGIHHYNIAATALFLANKTEENCRKTKDIIIAVARVAQKNAKLIIDEQSKEYWRWRDSILLYEELMLELITFDIMIDNPYQRLFELLGQLDVVHNKQLRHAAWGFCNDACLTTLPLLMEARDLAISAIYFASIHTKQTIDDVRGMPWYAYLHSDQDKCSAAIDAMVNFYNENPLRRQNPSLPSPPFSLDSTRRRGGSLMSSQTPPSHAVGTPMDLDNSSTQSPRPRTTNGGAGPGAGGLLDREPSEAKTEPSSHTARFDASSSKDKDDRAMYSPSSSSNKRRALDSDAESEAGRQRARRERTEDEDEGEVVMS